MLFCSYNLYPFCLVQPLRLLARFRFAPLTRSARSIRFAPLTRSARSIPLYSSHTQCSLDSALLLSHAVHARFRFAPLTRSARSIPLCSSRAVHARFCFASSRSRASPYASFRVNITASKLSFIFSLSLRTAHCHREHFLIKSCVCKDIITMFSSHYSENVPAVISNTPQWHHASPRT